MTVPGPSPRRLQVYDLLHLSTQVFRVTLPKCLPLAMIMVLFAEVPNLYWLVTGHPLTHMPPDDTLYWVLWSAMAIVWVFLFSTLLLRQRVLIGGTAAHIKLELVAVGRRFPLLVASWFLAQMAMAAGLMLLLVPGVILFVCCLVVLPVALFEPLTPLAVIARSVRLIWPHWWQVFAAVVIGFICAAVVGVVIVAILEVLASFLVGEGNVLTAVMAASLVAVLAMAFVFLSAFSLSLYSSASSSA